MIQEGAKRMSDRLRSLKDELDRNMEMLVQGLQAI